MADKDVSDFNRGNSGDMFAPGWGQVGYEMHRQRAEREKKSSYSSGSRSSSSGPADLSGLFWLFGILAVGTFVYQVIMPNMYWLIFYVLALVASYVACFIAGYSGKSKRLWLAAVLLLVGTGLFTLSLHRLADYSIINIFCFYAPVAVPASISLYYFANDARPLPSPSRDGGETWKLVAIDLGITALAAILVNSIAAAFFESSYSFWDIGAANDDPRRLKLWWVAIVSCHLLVWSRRMRIAA